MVKIIYATHILLHDSERHKGIAVKYKSLYKQNEKVRIQDSTVQQYIRVESVECERFTSSIL